MTLRYARTETPTKLAHRAGRGGPGDPARDLSSLSGPGRGPPALPGLLVPQSFDRVEARRFAGGIEPEEDPDAGREAEGDHDRLRGDERTPLREIADRPRAPQAEGNADDPADERQGDRLDQELEQDVAPAGSHRHAET